MDHSGNSSCILVRYLVYFTLRHLLYGVCRVYSWEMAGNTDMDMTEDMHSVELFSTEELTIQIRRARPKVREIQRDREGQRDRDAQR